MCSLQRECREQQCTAAAGGLDLDPPVQKWSCPMFFVWCDGAGWLAKPNSYFFLFLLYSSFSFPTLKITVDWFNGHFEKANSSLALRVNFMRCQSSIRAVPSSLQWPHKKDKNIKWAEHYIHISGLPSPVAFSDSHITSASFNLGVRWCSNVIERW